MTARTIPVLFSPVDAVVAVPGSKSIANRALVCAALADAPSTLRNLPDGDDTEAAGTAGAVEIAPGKPEDAVAYPTFSVRYLS